MKELHELVNIIPVIAKADTLTPNELKSLKQKVGEWRWQHLHSTMGGRRGATFCKGCGIWDHVGRLNQVQLG